MNSKCSHGAAFIELKFQKKKNCKKSCTNIHPVCYKMIFRDLRFFLLREANVFLLGDAFLSLLTAEILQTVTRVLAPRPTDVHVSLTKQFDIWLAVLFVLVALPFLWNASVRFTNTRMQSGSFFLWN